MMLTLAPTIPAPTADAFFQLQAAMTTTLALTTIVSMDNAFTSNCSAAMAYRVPMIPV